MWGSRICTYNQFPGDANTPSQETTLFENYYYILATRKLEIKYTRLYIENYKSYYVVTNWESWYSEDVNLPQPALSFNSIPFKISTGFFP